MEKDQNRPSHGFDSVPSASMDDRTTTSSTKDSKKMMAADQLRLRLQTWLPVTFAKARQSAKAAIAMLIGVIMTLSSDCRRAVGSGSLLAAIVCVFYFPTRTVGVVFEDVIYGSFGALVAAAWSILGMYVANLARDPNNPVPVQPASSGVLILFLFVAAFVLSYIRIKFPKTNFACINASILIMFSVTQCSMTPGFYPAIIWAFLKPIALGGGISLAVSFLIWPDDSISNYMKVLNDLLMGINTTFREQTEAFMSHTWPMQTNPSLDQLSEKLILLIDSKRAVRREVLYSLVSGNDTSRLTKLVKQFSTPLQGLQLCLRLKAELHEEENGANKDTPPSSVDGDYPKVKLADVFKDMQPLCSNFLEATDAALTEAMERLKPFKGRADRSTLNSLLWPFPRLFSSTSPSHSQQKTATAETLAEAIEQLERATPEHLMLLTRNGQYEFGKNRTKPLHLFALYQFNIREHAKNVLDLIHFIEYLEQHRVKRRLWFLSNMSLKKWFRPQDVDADMGGEFSNDFGEDGPQMALVRTYTRTGDTVGAGEQSAFIKAGTGRMYFRDPDVEPPATAIQRGFEALHKVRNWFTETDTFFAFKTAGGVILLALPVFLAHSYSWYVAWRGQWALFTLMLWMFPMAGMFLFTVMMRLVGTILGGVLGGVVWEITRGNPYGIGVLLYFCFWLLYHIFFYQPRLRLVAIMTLVTLTLVVVYEYIFKVSGAAVYEGVWEVAGKRILLVSIGVVASAILSIIPYQVTGRVELRKQLAQTIRDIGKLHGVLSTQFMDSALAHHAVTPEQVKSFRKLAINLKRQIAEERTLLKLSVFEPPLRGVFPKAKYATLLSTVESMADRVYCMGYAMQLIQSDWRIKVANTVTRERRDFLAVIMTTMKLLSATLLAKMALPPYMIEPKEARSRYKESLERSVKLKPETLSNPSFLPFSSFIVNSDAFVSDVQNLLDAVEGLVGVEDPEEWLKMHL